MEGWLKTQAGVQVANLINRQPGYVTNGLILYLDASNASSYSGTGNQWLDLSGLNNHFTLYNSPSYAGSYLNFNGSNQYARTNNTLNLSPYDSVTVEIAFMTNTTSTPSGMAFEHSSDWNANSMGFGLIPNSNGSTTYVSNSHHTNMLNGQRFDYDGTQGAGINIHTNIFSRISDATGRDAYINGVQRGVLSGSRTSGAYAAFRNDHLFVSARGGSSVFANHRVYHVLVYGRKLNSIEIQQNFNMFRSRYGL